MGVGGSVKAAPLLGGTIGKWLGVLAVSGAAALGGYGYLQYAAETPPPVESVVGAQVPQIASVPERDLPTDTPPAPPTVAIAPIAPTAVAVAEPPAPQRATSSAATTASKPRKDEPLAKAPPARAEPSIEQSRFDEAALVLSARRALRNGSPERALALLRDAPAGGLLAQEREVLEIEALIQVGDTDIARRRAASFSTRYPLSPHAARLNRLLE